jgi:hypothetical protein
MSQIKQRLVPREVSAGMNKRAYLWGPQHRAHACPEMGSKNRSYWRQARAASMTAAQRSKSARRAALAKTCAMSPEERLASARKAALVRWRRPEPVEQAALGAG